MYNKYQLLTMSQKDVYMLNKITTADARKKFSNIINRVAFGDESFVLTRRGEPIAALVSMKELQLLQEIEDQIDIEDAWKAKNEPGEPIPWDELKKELGLWNIGLKSSDLLQKHLKNTETWPKTHKPENW